MSIDTLIEKELVFVSGKGGVGKTFTAAWLANYAVSQGKKVLLVESGSIAQLGAYFNHSAPLNEITKAKDQLSLLHIDFDGCLRDYLNLRLKRESIRAALFSNKIMRSFLDAIPGLPEVMMLGRLYYSASREEEYDLVIYDAPAFGHFLNLMTTLDAMIDTGLGGPLIDQVTKIMDYLALKEVCGAVFVTTPEELVINETFDFLPRLQKLSPVSVDGMAFNHCFEDSIEGHLEKELGDGLYKYVSSKVSNNQVFQDQISKLLKDHSVPVLLKFRELGKVVPATFFEQAWLRPSEQISR